MHIFHIKEEIKVNVIAVQELINKTDYYDGRVYNFYMDYFGDEVYVLFEKDIDKCYKLTFLQCYKVSYETDAKIRTGDDLSIKKRKLGQFDYFMQDISINKSELDDYMNIEINMSFLVLSITCKDIKIEEVNIKDENFFWNINN